MILIKFTLKPDWMRCYLKCALVLLVLLTACDAIAQTKKYVLVVHGGAGTILKGQLSPEREKAYTEALTASLRCGYTILKSGGTSLQAVEAVIRLMEDDSLFNAGKGAVFTHDGRNELDAAIMNGRTLEAGAVANVRRIKNPISAARAVMETSPHIMMTGPGAEQFAQSRGLILVDPVYFRTESRWKALQKARVQDSLSLLTVPDKKTYSRLTRPPADHKFGTVGCVALDQAGNLAAGTSTGGMTNKKYGRIGDTPIIGAGTYCDNRTAGISCTGWGEFFIRTVAAKTICDLIAYEQLSVAAAAQRVLDQIAAMGGSGGLIILDQKGNMAQPFNTAGMYRGAITESGQIEVSIYR